MFKRFGKSKAPAKPTPQDNEKYFAMTSARWLWNEEEQQAAHYRKFNVEALQGLAVSKVDGAKRCVSMEKISELGGNKIFKLKMDNKKSVIAKIPHPAGDGAGVLRLQSEAATMHFAGTIDIPVPRLLAHSTGDDAVGIEYILMEDVVGDTPTGEAWEKKGANSRIPIIIGLASIVSKLASVSFTHIGNIYFAKDNVPGAVPALVKGVSPELQATIQKLYTIGPSVDQVTWTDERSTIDKGPWSSAKAYWDALARREITFLEKYAATRPRTQKPLQPAPKGTVQEHIDTWKKFQAASAILDLCKPGLLHSSLMHAGISPDCLVLGKKDKIVALIDWEYASVQPLALSYSTPGFLFPQDDTLPLPGMETGKITFKETIQAMKAMQFVGLRYVWQGNVQNECPLLMELEQQPYPDIKQLFSIGIDTWDYGLWVMQTMPINLNAKWTEITGKECPYTITEEDKAQSAAQNEDFQTMAQFSIRTRDSTTQDGLVKKGDYDVVVAELSNLAKDFWARTISDEARREIAGSLRWMLKLNIDKTMIVELERYL